MGWHEDVAELGWMGPRLRGDDEFEVIVVDDTHRIFGRIALRHGLGFAPCWGESLFFREK